MRRLTRLFHRRQLCPSRRARLVGSHHWKNSKVVFDINPHLTEEDRQAILEHEQDVALADGIGA